jgi:hypothetical protein
LTDKMVLVFKRVSDPVFHEANLYKTETERSHHHHQDDQSIFRPSSFQGLCIFYRWVTD